MIDNKKFYPADDSPDYKTRKRIWAEIYRSTWNQKEPSLKIYKLPGFYYGFACAVVFFFAFYGLYSFGNDIVYKSSPEEIKLNSAYQSAIREFEQVIPEVIKNSSGENIRMSIISVKMGQLKSIDDAISKLKQENSYYDISPLKQVSLRNLYIMKLKLLQEIVDQGEFSL